MSFAAAHQNKTEFKRWSGRLESIWDKRKNCGIMQLSMKKAGKSKMRNIIPRFFPGAYEKLRRREAMRYQQRKRKNLKNEDFTILASNCNGTFMYYDLNLPYLSPTINLSIGMDDFVKMAGNLKWYMQQEITLSGGPEAYPVGMLADVRIQFVHYADFAEGVAQWNERKKRINWDNLFIVGTQKDGCSYETLQKFDQLPYENKVVFTKTEYPEFQSACYMKGFEAEEELGVLTNYKEQFRLRRYLDDFDYVSFLNKEWREKK